MAIELQKAGFQLQRRKIRQTLQPTSQQAPSNKLLLLLLLSHQLVCGNYV